MQLGNKFYCDVTIQLGVNLEMSLNSRQIHFMRYKGKLLASRFDETKRSENEVFATVFGKTKQRSESYF